MASEKGNDRFWLGSIHVKMTLVILGFVGIIAYVTSISIFGLGAQDAKMRFIEQVGLVETHFFGELADKLSELRLTETLVHHAETEPERLESLQLLALRRASVGQLMSQMDAIMPGRVDAAQLDRFRKAWRRYAELHDRQFSLVNDGSSEDGVRSAIHKAYGDAEQALDILIEDSQARINSEVEASNDLSRQIMTTMAIAAALATCVALLLYRAARKNIFAPLREITEALTALAQGRTDVELPERKAHDEIGDLAAACRVFRANLAELEEAHRVAKIARKAAETMALADPLTNLPNRRALAAKLRRYFAAGDGAPSCALLIVDLDRFKPVNDLLGHMVGDLVLCAVAKRLQEAAARAGMVARLGGDEFAVVIRLADGADARPAQEMARRIREALRAPIQVADHRIEIDASIGIALSRHAADATTLLSCADIAMYRGKKSQHDPICLFEPEMQGELRRRVDLEKALRRALQAGEVRPHYQPIIDLSTRRLTGFEILARWSDPEIGPVSPEIFIPLAEQQGLILELSTAMLAQACRDAARWPLDITLSMNVSPVQLRDRRFPELLLESLRAHGFPPQRLELEITETALIGDVDEVRDILVRLRAAGIKVSLDDFGMGYSSLNHLRQFRIDKVKIDKSFTGTVFEDPESALIVRSVISLARGLRLAVVAEGIEDERTAEMMGLMGCDLGQGFHFGKAVDGDGAAALALPQGAREAAA